MRAARVVADRFEVERLAGEGGMGTVYRARDRLTGGPVALKLMTEAGKDPDGSAARFLREAALLAQLTHPGVVRYVAHGLGPDGERYLAMEWLEGETLADRLDRGRLSIEESVALARRAADALGAAHALGIVHRDVKPTNLFLVGGAAAAVKVLDFGIARRTQASRAITRTGAVVGTIGYMAPEQARGSGLDARADVFALGSVLHECLTGVPAFAGDDMLAIVAKLLLEDPPRARTLREDVPEPLDALLETLLSKDPARRPPDGRALAEALDALGSPPATTAAVSASVVRDADAPRLGGRELALLSVIVLATDEGQADATVVGETTVLREVSLRFGAELWGLTDGAVLATLRGQGAPTEQAARAERLAHELAALRPRARAAIATGTADTSGPVPVGGVIDRAVSLLRSARAGEVRHDDTTAALLSGRVDAEPRTLLGRPTDVIGRDKELAFVEATWAECVEEPVARAVLVVGAPGLGKSRLAHEVVRRLRARGDVRVLQARADPVYAGATLGLAAELVGSSLGLLGEGAQARLRALVDELVPAADAVRVREFLLELLHAPVAEPSALLRAARNDPRLMNDHTARALQDWLGALCRSGPLLLLVEDLHWGDAESAAWLTAAIRQHAGAPLFVLAMARPEARDLFPDLWRAPRVAELVLEPLTRSAAERLVRAALGPRVGARTLERIVERADGNPFHLEELVRHFAERGSDAPPPETLLAMVQARLERLEPEARRILRAASVFGEVFWTRGVRALVGGADPTEWLDRLVDRELLQRGEQRRFAGEDEYKFRHGLLREAAFTMLTEEDRTLGHRLAAEWLEQAGERDARVIAEHFERGGARDRAAPWFTRAAQVAIEAGNIEGALVLCGRASSAGVAGELLARVRLIEAEALGWRSSWREALAAGTEAMQLFPEGSLPWFRAVGAVAFTGAQGAQPAALLSVLQALGSLREQPEANAPYAQALAVLTLVLGYLGQAALTDPLHAPLEGSARASSDPDPSFLGWLHLARAWRATWSEDLGGVVVELGSARDRFAETGDALGHSTAAFWLGVALVEAGAYERAERSMAEAVEFLERCGAHFIGHVVRNWRARALLAQGRPDACLEMLAPLLDASEAQLRGRARSFAAAAHLVAGRTDDAVRDAMLGLEASSMLLTGQPAALAVLAEAALLAGRPAEALHHAERGLDAARAMRAIATVFSMNRLAWLRARALGALGKSDEAAHALEEARRALHRLADSLGDPELRRSFLEAVPESAELDRS